MPASYIQANGRNVSFAVATAITSSALSITTGRYLFVHASHYTTGINVSAVVQTGGGNTFVKAGSTQGGDANQDNEIWYTPDPIVGTTSATVEVRFTGSADFRVVQVAEFSWGGVTSISYDAESTHALASGSARTSNAVTPTQADDLILGAWVAYDTPQALSSGSATIMDPALAAGADDFAMGYRLADSVSAYTMSLVGPIPVDRYSVIAKAFRGVGAGTATAADLHTLTLTNAGS